MTLYILLAEVAVSTGVVTLPVGFQKRNDTGGQKQTDSGIAKIQVLQNT